MDDNDDNDDDYNDVDIDTLERRDMILRSKREPHTSKNNTNTKNNRIMIRPEGNSWYRTIFSISILLNVIFMVIVVAMVVPTVYIVSSSIS